MNAGILGNTKKRLHPALTLIELPVVSWVKARAFTLIELLAAPGTRWDDDLQMAYAISFARSTRRKDYYVLDWSMYSSYTPCPNLRFLGREVASPDNSRSVKFGAPANYPMAADYPSGRGNYRLIFDGVQSSPPNHKGNNNIVFFDGHVKYFVLQQQSKYLGFYYGAIVWGGMNDKQCDE